MVHHAYVNSLAGVKSVAQLIDTRYWKREGKKEREKDCDRGPELGKTLETRPVILLVGRRVAERRGLLSRTLLRRLLPGQKVLVSRLGIPDLQRPVKLRMLLS
jgi:hypothetical protein